MPEYQFFILIGMLAGGFGWIIYWLRSIDKSVANLDKRLTVIETILTMMGISINFKKQVNDDE